MPGHKTVESDGKKKGGTLLSFLFLVLLLSSGQVACQKQETPKAKRQADAAISSTQKVDNSVLKSPKNLPTASVKPWPMKTNEAVMVTVELDFAGQPVTIAEALPYIERVHRPADGVGRSFAILDAYGEMAPDGRLHISMHVSSEKPGQAALVFRRTGDTLWKGEIAPDPNTQPFTRKNLTILIENAKGEKNFIDGSKNPATILSAKVRDLGMPVSDYWPDGAEREVTFVYSACGCPVNVKVKRVGNQTVRTNPLPVIFPDDPPAVAVINKLMGW